MEIGKNIPKQRYALDFLKNVLTAGIASSIVVSVMAPIERVKLILQVQNSFPEFVSPSQRYLGIFPTIKSLAQTQGIWSLWRGNTAAICRSFPYQAVNFATKDMVQTMLSTGHMNTTAKKFGISFISGGVAGASAITTVYPLDYARMRMALEVSNGKGPANGSRRKARTIRQTIASRYRKYGFFGLYRGYIFSVIGVFWYRALYFGFYDLGKLLTPKKDRGILSSIIEAQLASMASGFLSYPADTVRRNMMMQGSLNRQQFTAWQSIKRIYTQDRLIGFYHGAGVNLIRSSGGALMLVLYDILEEYLWHKDKFAIVTDETVQVQPDGFCCGKCN